MASLNVIYKGIVLLENVLLGEAVGAWDKGFNNTWKTHF